jgi:hypothetical protein
MATEQELAQALGPAFGIYPKAFRGNYGNPQDAANLPVDVLRGRTAGLLGMFGDVVNQPIAFPPARAAQLAIQGLSGQEQYKYPDTEHFLKTMPLAPTSRAGEVAGQAASYVPLNPAPLVRAGVAGAKALAPTAARMTEGYLQRQGLMPGVVPDQPSLLGNMTQPVTKPMAEVSPLGFYSAVEQQALNIPRKQGSGESFLNDLAKGQDVKKYEMETMGLDEFLRGKPNVTRQEVQDYIAGNRINVQEKQLGGAVTEDPMGIAQRKAVFDKYEPQIQALYKDIDSFGYNTPREVTQSTDNRLRALQEMRDAEANAYYTVPEPTPTKYDKYQLPGGENYREILLTLPEKMPKTLPEGYSLQSMANGNFTLVNPDNIGTTLYAKSKDAAMEEAIRRFTIKEEPYRSSHFNEPNILAHMRVNDRIDADGKKMLLIEEVQSDWHQAGRERGYATKENLEKWYNQNKLENDPSFADLNSEQRSVVERNRNAGMSGNSVPDAPFKDTWHQLALKRALKEAVDKGYDRIGLTTGAQQAERYQLSKQISEVHYSGTNFKAYDLDGNEVITRTGVKPEDLPGLIGKEPAKKRLEQPKQGTLQSLTGQNLDVGGEGMKKYYDEIYPAFLNKVGKKFGAQVGETRIKTGRGVPGGEPVRYLDITPEMRKAIKEGQPIASIENELAKALA